MTAPIRPDMYVQGIDGMRTLIASTMGHPVERVGHIMIIAEVINPCEGADFLVCCGELLSDAPDILRSHAASLELKTEGDLN